MNLPEEKQKLYERLQDLMYQESLRTNHTPIPKELEDPAEWSAFCEWRHQNWQRLGKAFLQKFDRWLEQKEPAVPAMSLAEIPPPYPSKT